MQLSHANVALTKSLLLSGTIALASCALPQKTEEAVITPPVIAIHVQDANLENLSKSSAKTGPAKQKFNEASLSGVSANPGLPELLNRALSYHPEIRAAGFERRARQAEVQQASRVPNPEIETELENFAGSGGFSGFEGSETTVAISQTIELGGKRQKRTKEAIRHTRVAAFDIETKRLEVFQDTAQRFYQVLAAQEELKVTASMLSSARRLEQEVNTRVRAGRANILEQQRVKLISSRAKVTHDQARFRLSNSLRALASVVGLPLTGFESVKGNLFKVSHPLAETVLRSHLPDNPRAGSAAAEVARRQAALARVRSERIPDLSLTAGTRFDQESNDRAFVASIGLPLPIFNRNKGAIAAAEARVNQGIFEQQAQNIGLETLFTEHYSALVSTAQQTLTLRKELIPAARLNFQTTNRAFQRGGIDLVSLISSQQTISQLELEAVRSAAQYQMSRIALESLLGRSVTSSHKTAQ